MDYQTAFIVTIVTMLLGFLTVFIKKLLKHLKKSENSNVNVFGKQTINNKKETPEQHIVKGVDKTIERLDKGAKKFDDLYEKINENSKKFDELSNKLSLLMLAFDVYVQNNGVNKQAKGAVKKILNKAQQQGDK